MSGANCSRSLLPLLTLLALAVTLVAASAFDPTMMGRAGAQADPGGTGYAVQTPPPVPGIDYSTAGTLDTAAAPVLTDAATPVPPVIPAEATKVGLIPDPSGAVTTNLGGEDISVSSTGGSYEVDGPKRRARRLGRETPVAGP